VHLVTHRGASEQGVICFLLVTMAAPYSSTASASILSLRSSSYVLAFASNSAPPSACRVGGLYSGGPCDSFNTMRLNNGPSTTTKTNWHKRMACESVRGCCTFGEWDVLRNKEVKDRVVHFIFVDCFHTNAALFLLCRGCSLCSFLLVFCPHTFQFLQHICLHLALVHL
jgi:hypothetical protein